MSETDDSPSEGNTTEESTENNMKTILYCKTRAALSAKDLETISEVLSEEGYVLTPSDEGDKVMIQREKEEEAADVLSVLE